MKNDIDPLAIVRESRIRLSHEGGNDPKRVIANLRKLEVKYARQVERYRLSHSQVAESGVVYGKGGR